ncbi:MAG: hypothetical protein MUF33_06830 [Candidatus Nanopelagicales bacterium]|nr:hypothetical protein [Candidatus Nanopelagicales bacterium]
MVAVDAGNPTTGPDISLVTGRVLQHYQTGAQTRRVTVLDKAVPEPYVQVHPTLAQRLNIAEGDIVDVRSPRGTARARARLSVNIRPDTLFMPFHWGGSGCVNRVTEDVCDPVSGMPAFKLTDVTVTPALGQVC